LDRVPSLLTSPDSGAPSIRQSAWLAWNPSLALGIESEVHPDGRTVTVIGESFPANVEIQLAECTGLPLACQALVNVNTSQRGMFIARALVAFDFTVLNPFSLVPTCSVPTFTLQNLR
jgi:hypothetical protein